jgi:hypothetical protein
MTIYYLLFAYWGIAAIVLNQMSIQNGLRLKHNSKVYFYVAGISLLLLMSLRGISVGTDLLGYQWEYENGLFRNAEPLFSYFNYVLKELGISFQFYLTIIAVIVITAITLLYYKYSKNILLSYYLHVTIGLFAMSMTGLRQTIAVCLTIFAFVILMKNKKLLFFAFVGVAYFFHNSAIAFLLVYFIKNIRIKKKTGLIVYALSTLAFICKKWIVILVAYVTPVKYLKYLELADFSVNPLVIIVSMAIPLACLVFWSDKIWGNNEEQKRVMSTLLIMSIFNMVINIFALNIDMFARLTFYFITYNTVLIPNIIQGIKDSKIRIIAKTACIILPLIQFSMATPGGSLGIDQYIFFWE